MFVPPVSIELHFVLCIGTIYFLENIALSTPKQELFQAFFLQPSRFQRKKNHECHLD